MLNFECNMETIQKFYKNLFYVLRSNNMNNQEEEKALMKKDMISLTLNL